MGVLWGTLTALGIGLSELFGRRVTLASTAATAAVTLQTFALALTVAVAPFITGTTRGSDIVWGLLSGIGMAAGIGLYFAALERSSASVVSPTVATLSAVIPYAWAVLRGAEVATIAVVGAAIAILGLAIVAAGTQAVTELRSGLAWGGLSGLGYGLGLSVFVEVGDDASGWPATAQRAGALVVLLIAAIALRAPLSAPRGTRLSAVGSGAWAGLTSVFLLLGLAVDAPSTLVTASMFPIASVAFGYAVFGDAVGRRQLFGVALALVGIGLVVSPG